MRKISGLLIGVLLSAGMLESACAEMQRWEDENGVIYYRETSIVDATARAPDKEARAAKPKRSSAARSPNNASRHKQQIKKDQARAQDRQKKQCDRLQLKLTHVEQSLDDGYREPQGNKLRRQRRELKSRLFRECH